MVDHLLLSRLQFAFTALFHILWPVHIIGMSIFLAITEATWIRTKNDLYYQHLRFWNRLFLLNIAIGVATGLVMEFQFGTNWSLFSQQGGGVLGHLLGFEAAMAFMLEASFIGIMLIGWKYVGRWPHFISTSMVALGGTLSAFWIMVSNSWMQTPSGGYFEKGVFKVTSNYDAIFNPNWFWGVSHMWFACILISLFSVGGISAFYLIRGRHVELFLKSFKMAVAACIVIAPLQVYLGDGSGRSVFHHQPTKLAGMEMHWNTNPEGQGAPWHIVAWPDSAAEKNAWEVNMPYGLSLITTRTPTGQVKGLREFRPDERPPLLLPFYAFRGMIALGFGFAALALWSAWAWWRRRLVADRVPRQKKLLIAWMLATPGSYTALELGWIVREVGRQPWVVYNAVRTADAVTPLPAAGVATTLLALGFTYLVLTIAFTILAALLIARGPGFIAEDERKAGVYR